MDVVLFHVRDGIIVYNTFRYDDELVLGLEFWISEGIEDYFRLGSDDGSDNCLDDGESLGSVNVVLLVVKNGVTDGYTLYLFFGCSL